MLFRLEYSYSASGIHLVFYNKINISTNNSSFMSRWGSLFKEFKNDRGFFSSQYYFIYFSRRLAYLLAQAYLNNNPFIQGAVIVGSSFVQFGYLMFYRLFKEMPILISSIISETCTFTVLSLSNAFLMNLSSFTTMILEQTNNVTVIGAIVGQMLVSIYTTVNALLNLKKKIMINRVQAFLKTGQQQQAIVYTIARA
jgi:hypothetical protein